MGIIDSTLGKALEEKSYADDCSLTIENLKVKRRMFTGMKPSSNFFSFSLESNGFFHHCARVRMVRKNNFTP